MRAKVLKIRLAAKLILRSSIDVFTSNFNLNFQIVSLGGFS